MCLIMCVVGVNSQCRVLTQHCLGCCWYKATVLTACAWGDVWQVVMDCEKIVFGEMEYESHISENILEAGSCPNAQGKRQKGNRKKKAKVLNKLLATLVYCSWEGHL